MADILAGAGVPPAQLPREFQATPLPPLAAAIQQPPADVGAGRMVCKTYHNPDYLFVFPPEAANVAFYSTQLVDCGERDCAGDTCTDSDDKSCSANSGYDSDCGSPCDSQSDESSDCSSSRSSGASRSETNSGESSDASCVTNALHSAARARRRQKRGRTPRHRRALPPQQEPNQSEHDTQARDLCCLHHRHHRRGNQSDNDRTSTNALRDDGNHRGSTKVALGDRHCRSSGRVSKPNTSSGEEDHGFSESDQAEADPDTHSCAMPQSMASRADKLAHSCCHLDRQQTPSGKGSIVGCDSCSVRDQKPCANCRQCHYCCCCHSRCPCDGHVVNGDATVNQAPQPRRQRTLADLAPTECAGHSPTNHATIERKSNRQTGKAHIRSTARHKSNIQNAYPAAVCETLSSTAHEAPRDEPSWLSVFHQLLFGEDYPQFRDRMIKRAAALASAAPM